MSPGYLSILLIAFHITGSASTPFLPFTGEVDSVVSDICKYLTFVPATEDGRVRALSDVLRMIDAAGSSFVYDVRNELNVLGDLPIWAVFISKVQRLEYLVDQVQYYKRSDVSESEKVEFADTLLDFGTDGLSQVLHVIHGSVVQSSLTSSSSIYAVYNNRRKLVSSNYMKETIQFAKELINLQTYGYTAGIWACNIKNNLSCFDRFTNIFIDRLEAQDLFLSNKRVYAFSAPNVQSSFNWCSCGSCKPFLGDFNGDRKSDVLCFKSDGSSRLTTFDDATLTFKNKNSPWYNVDERCDGGILSVGYLNHDRRSDVLCLNPRERHNKIRMVYATTSGYLRSNTGWTGNHDYVTRCFNRAGVAGVYTGDFNGDGRTDIMCQNHVTGDMSITSNPNHRILGTWRWVIPWCRTSTTELFVGDFNGDRRDDLLCHDWQTGGSSLRIASTRGTFMSGVAWRGLSGFCQDSSRRSLYVGDFNGDRKQDLLCYTQRSNSRDTIKIAYSNTRGNFGGSNIVQLYFDWCSSPGVRLRNVSDVNGDGRDDLICYDRNNQMRVSVNGVYLYFSE